MTLLHTPGVAVEHNYLVLPDLRLHYARVTSADAPVAPAMILIHGYGDSWRSFDLVLPGLAELGQVYAVDVRGHGESQYAGDDFSLESMGYDIAVLIERLRLAPAVVIGHSMGSLVARTLARLQPQLLDRLVLIGTCTRVDTPGMQPLTQEIAALGTSAPRAFVEEFERGCIYQPESVPGSFLKACIDNAARTPGQTWRAAWRALLAADDLRLLGEIRHPTLVIGGREDAVFSAEDQAAVAGAIPEARLLLYGECGHSPIWEQPARLVRDIAAFLRSE